MPRSRAPLVTEGARDGGGKEGAPTVLELGKRSPTVDQRVTPASFPIVTLTLDRSEGGQVNVPRLRSTGRERPSRDSQFSSDGCASEQDRGTLPRVNEAPGGRTPQDSCSLATQSPFSLRPATSLPPRFRSQRPPLAGPRGTAQARPGPPTARTRWTKGYCPLGTWP